MLLLQTALVRLLGLRIPALLFLGPRVLELDEEGCAVLIPLTLRSKNHLGSMYFGALCVGAELAAGLNAFDLIRRRYRGVALVFKHAKAEFLKRADAHVVFRCREGRAVASALAQTQASGERVTIEVEVVATAPRKYGEEPIARFVLGLSLKREEPRGTYGTR